MLENSDYFIKILAATKNVDNILVRFPARTPLSSCRYDDKHIYNTVKQVNNNQKEV